VGLFKKKPVVDPAEVAALRAELTEVRTRLEQSLDQRAMLEAHVIQLDATTHAINSRTQALDDVTMRLAEVDVLKRQVAMIDVVNAKISSLDHLNGKLTELAQQVVASNDEARHTKEQVATLNQRIASVSTELVNQIGELSNELDALAKRPLPDPIMIPQQTVSDDVVSALKEGQVRLANEQARYEIAFRQDLATLAEQVRRGRAAP